MINEYPAHFETGDGLQSALKERWKIGEKISPDESDEQPTQQERYRKIKVKQTSQRVTVMAIYLHLEKVLEVRSHASYYQAQRGQALLLKQRQYDGRMRGRKRHP